MGQLTLFDEKKAGDEKSRDTVSLNDPGSHL
jgi:hypothetical protein